MSAPRHCPALLITAPASGQGKTTTTAALARYHRNQGRRVRVFKTGPDFLDPMILERASGNPVYQLDLWMVGEAHCRQLLWEAAADADLILVEGVMGLFDGQPSSADLAVKFGLPVLAVIDAGAMAQTFGAVAYGLAHYREDLVCAGVAANMVAGERHSAMLAESLPEGLRLWASLPRDAGIALPDRHLGLVQAVEIIDIEKRLDYLADVWMKHGFTNLPDAITFDPVNTTPLLPLLEGVCIAVARDAAFSFLYQANLDLLTTLGAELVFFSPLRDAALPQADSLYLPGGYPELHGAQLAANHGMIESVRAHHVAGKPIVAECGGMLYLLESLTGVQGHREDMAGLLPGHAAMQKRFTALALQQVVLPEGILRGHTFHHSLMTTSLTPMALGQCPNGGKTGEAVYRDGKLAASYIHFYLPSSPTAAARLFQP